MNIEKELLKSRVTENVTFVYFRDSSLWYACKDGWLFPVPVSDTLNPQGGSATFNAVEKGIIMMRWIRQAMLDEARNCAEAAAQALEAQALGSPPFSFMCP